MVKIQNRPEIRPLTGIRGFAALLVLMIHFFPLWVSLLPALQGLNRMAGRGFVGVDLFFILSGFILNYVYFDLAKPRLDVASYRSFVWHRFIRIWPVHFATLLLLMGLVFSAGFFHVALTGKYSWDALPFQLTMTHAWPITPTGSGSDPIAAFTWNYPSWSISAEWFAYLLIFPATWWLLHRLHRLPGDISFLLGTAVITVWVLILRQLPLAGWGMVGGVTIEFITGALLYQTFMAVGKIAGFCQRFASLLFIIVLIAMLTAPVGITPWIILMFPWLLLGLTAETSWIARCFAARPALWLGRVSFSMYMTQAIVQRFLKVVLVPSHYQQSPLPLRLLLVAGTVILILATASAFYYLVENPSRTYLRDWANCRKAPQTTPR